MVILNEIAGNSTNLDEGLPVLILPKLSSILQLSTRGLWIYLITLPLTLEIMNKLFIS